jgi:cell division ATPase FtsA
MLFGKSPQGSLILILDIQSSIVRASVVHLQKDKLPTIVYAFTKNVPYRQNTGSGRIVQVTLDALKEIMTEVHHFLETQASKLHLPKKLHEAHIALSSPWVISQAKTLTHTFKQPIEITEKLILDIIAEERNSLIPETLKGNKVDLIEEKISNVRLNGYIVHDWKGKRSSDIEVSFTISIAGSNTSDLLRSVCTIVPRNRIYFHSSLLLQYIAIAQVLPTQSAYTLVHVHGELTDVAVIDHNSCIFFGSYPVGAYSVIRKVAKEGNTDVEVADSAIGIAEHAEANAAVTAGGQYWANEFKKMFEAVTPPLLLTPRTVLFGHIHEEFFAKCLKMAHPHIQPDILTLDEIRPFVTYAVDDAVRLSGLYAMAIHSIIQNNVI